MAGGGQESGQGTADTFTSAEAVIQVSDPDTGLLVGKAYLSADNIFATVKIKFTVKVENKEKRSRITFYDIYFEASSGSTTSKARFETQEAWNNYKQEFINMADSFEEYMTTSEDVW